MAEERLKEGEVVVLRSGGPDMVLVEILPGAGKLEKCVCLWFASDGSLQTAQIAMGALRRRER